MQTEQLNLKLEKPLFEEVSLISKVLHIPKNEWARNVLAHEVKKKLEEHKTSIAREYIKGNLTKNELVHFLGKRDANNVERIINVGKKTFEDAKKLSQEME